MRILSDGIVEEVFFPYKQKGNIDDGTKELRPSLPFIISGGENTERFYFQGINKFTQYKFEIRPEYFSDESRYYEVFPKRISDIISGNPDAEIYCVFDYDTVFNGRTKKESHTLFLSEIEDIQQRTPTCRITLCPSMPSIEYWFLLHFENKTELFKTSGIVNNYLSRYMKPYFPDSTKSFGKTMKTALYLNDLLWVNKLCSDGKLEVAIKNAKANIDKVVEDGDLNNQSYSYLYKVFN